VTPIHESSNQNPSQPFKVDAENHFLVSVDPTSSKIIAVAVPLHQENGAKDLKPKQIIFLNFFRARYHSASDVMDPKKQTNIWNDGDGTCFDSLTTVSS
jgi:hypothetical protein